MNHPPNLAATNALGRVGGCQHFNFTADVSVARLSDTEGGPVTGYAADLTVHCSECKLPFRFLGLPVGNTDNRAATNLAGTQLRAPMEPVRPTPQALRAVK